MLLLPQRRKIVTLIVEGLGGHKGPREPYVQKMGEESDTGSYELPDEDFALERSMAKLCTCMAQKDYSGMTAALKEFLEICGSKEEM